jgi:cytochrome c biogenesis protein CcmG/thiol:disulfide interchange protein DsbE
VGSPAPDFSSTGLEGNRLHLSSVEGPVLVNFWASWCTPCRDEFPRLASVHGRGVTVVGVVFRDSAESARAFARDQGAAWPMVVDPRQQVASAYGVALKPGIPVTFALDARHVVRARHLGPLSSTDVQRLLTLVR